MEPGIRYNRDMVKAVRQHVTVGPGGIVEVQSPDLPVGAEAEVIVLVDQPGSTPNATDAAERLAAFRRLRKDLNLTPEAAAKWIDELRQMRDEFGTHEGSQEP
jgi:hypothetical protein